MGVFAADGGKKKDGSNSEAVSYTVLNQFAYDFKDAKEVVWKVDGNCQKADFILNGEKFAAFYSLAGEYMGLTRSVSFKNVPVAAQKEISSQYSNYQIGEVIELQPKAAASVAEPFAASSTDDAKVYFVDLKNEKEEILVRVTSNSDVYFFKQIK